MPLTAFAVIYCFPRALLAAHGAAVPAHAPAASTALRLHQRAALQIPLALCHPHLFPPFSGDLEHSSLRTAPPFPPLARAVSLDLQLLSHHLLIDPHFTVHHAPLCPPVLGSSVCSPLRAPTLLPLLPARRSRSGARTACRDSSGPLGTCSMLFSTVSQSRTSPRAPAVPATASSNSQYLTRF
ncbi:hypothetical protein C8R47DRAFT_46399 [Mycena vitilis]|nr:hypothetical protein C8R47DRAFT_46399 [Mycena vitilis]